MTDRYLWTPQDWGIISEGGAYVMTDLSFFVHVSRLYQARFLKYIWDKYPGADEKPGLAVCLFFDGYAFERQGRNPSYAHAAVAAIQAVVQANEIPGRHHAQTVWEKFSNLLTGQKLNPNVNPLAHSDTGKCECFWCVFDEGNVISDAKKHIRDDQVKRIWQRLQQIRGIGPKIASFFLRDVAVAYGLPPRNSRELLQPIDVWVRRTVERLGNSNGMRDEDIARWIVANCEKPELANQGIWYFGAQVAQSEFRLLETLAALECAKALIEDHIKTLEVTVEAAKDWSEYVGASMRESMSLVVDNPILNSPFENGRY